MSFAGGELRYLSFNLFYVDSMKRLVIENFGPVTKADLELRDVNLLIGEQSIGKSTIAKLITIMTDFYSLSLLIHYGLEEWLEQLHSYDLDIYSKSNYHIMYVHTFDGKSINLKVNITRDKLTANLTKGKNTITDPYAVTSELFKQKRIFHEKKFIEKVSTILNKSKNSKSKADYSLLRQLMINSIYIPAERVFCSLFSKALPALTLVKEAIPNNLLRFSLDFQNAKTVYARYDSTLLNISYEYENSEDYFIDKSSHHRYSLSHASSGIQSTLPLLLVLEYGVNHQEYSSFVIEEPESNLYPDKQVELLRYILKTVKRDGRTMTITTHSPYLLSALNNSLFAGFMQKQFGEIIKEDIADFFDVDYSVSSQECSVYSLGEYVNGEGFYCKSIIDQDTGMIDSNALDGVSVALGDEFGRLEDIYIKHTK